MGGWWPEYSTPDTGVRTTRQFILACTQSSMRYCRAGTLVLSQQSELISHCGCWLAFFFFYSHSPISGGFVRFKVLFLVCFGLGEILLVFYYTWLGSV